MYRFKKPKNVYLDDPLVGEDEKKYIIKAIDHNYISSVGPFVRRFEDKFASYLKVKGAVSTQSGTSAIHIALHVLGIGQGDEVIVPDLTFVATVNPVLYVGAKPVFVDVDENTWTVDPVEIEKSITPRTKAIIPVHLYGVPCDMGKIMEIARKYDIFVIEDATESLGALYRGKFTGTLGDLGCFSFNGNKIITTGGGGMVVGKDISRLQHINSLINQARMNGKKYYHREMGFNYRMTNMEAAVGLAQLSKLSSFIARKKMFHRIYREELSDIPYVRFQGICNGGEASWWLTCITVKDKLASRLRRYMDREGVPFRRVFYPLSKLPYLSVFSYKKRGVVTNSSKIYKSGLCLPSSLRNTEDSVRYVCRVIKKMFRRI